MITFLRPDVVKDSMNLRRVEVFLLSKKRSLGKDSNRSYGKLVNLRQFIVLGKGKRLYYLPH